MSGQLPWFSDIEVEQMCDGLEQDAARIRFMRGLGLRVDRKPNGRPLAWRPGSEPPAAQEQNAPAAAPRSEAVAPGEIAADLAAYRERKAARRGQKAQGR